MTTTNTIHDFDPASGQALRVGSRGLVALSASSLTQQQLRAVLHYDALTGIFTWLVQRGGTARIGSVAGSRDAYGYTLIRIGNRNVKAHRLAWLYVHGHLPQTDIDHRNGDPSDNRIANLRLASRSQNLANTKRPCTNTSGLKGAFWVRSKNKWRASIQASGRTVHLGYFGSAQDAHNAYCRAAVAMHGSFARAS